jgi:alkanesulfonate monooxygenase SsuD/methylene tetrahydromethanopterin reductase-like flavin-dependent oxidoreductase (luciferase family)
MKVGIATFLVGDGIRPDVLARAAEERGLDSLFLTEHTHIPVSAGMVDRNGGPLDDKYRRTHDPFIALAFAASAT